jgi:hypothetical protein
MVSEKTLITDLREKVSYLQIFLIFRFKNKTLNFKS